MARAKKALAKLEKKGLKVQPIAEFKGALAKTFWGKAWCEGLEKYADYENRLPRGRSYVRNGSVCHLELSKGLVKAKVAGSHLYDVEIQIEPLDKARWQAICAKCAGRVGSLVELLQGKLSKEVMQIICAPETGMFPSPNEIKFSCSCPDWAYMCKHVAAVLYGIGRRFDDEPDQIFLLRGVDSADLLDQSLEATTEATADASELDVDDMGALFGIDLDMGGATQDAPGIPASPAEAKPAKQAKKTKEAKAKQSKPEPAPKPEPKPEPRPEPKPDPKPAPKPEPKPAPATAPQAGGKLPRPRGLVKADHPTGTAIRNLFKLSGLDEEAFAKAIGVTLVTMKRWLSTRSALRLKSDSVAALMDFQKALLDRLGYETE
ncbi:MAG: SWIM zinc finger family protein [Desulfovibrio sp.]|nr:SWIM zinc finger family protein [Desulfovibrio sp.]